MKKRVLLILQFLFFFLIFYMSFAYALTDEIKANSKTQYTVLNNNNEVFIAGDINIFQVIGDKEYTLEQLPNLYLKAEDGTYSQKCFLVSQGNGSYYFDTPVQNLDNSKVYYLEISYNNNNLQITLTNESFFRNNLHIQYINNKITISNTYESSIKATSKTQYTVLNSNNEAFIAGNLYIIQILGNKEYHLTQLPNLYLKSQDGSYSQKCFLVSEGNDNYYFDTLVQNLDISKNYYLEVFYNNTVSRVNLTDDTFFRNNLQIQYKNNSIIISKNKIEATSKTQYTVLNNNNKTFIAGDLHIIQILDGKKYNLSQLPSLHLKSTDGTISQKCFLVNQGNGNYYFDTPINSLDKSKIYYLELSHSNNISKVHLTNDTFFRENLFIQYDNNNITIADISDSTIRATSQTQYTVLTSNNEAFIVGDLNIVQVFGNKNYSLTQLPNLYLKSTDGIYSQKCFLVSQGDNRYYFDTPIENLDVSKTYYLEVTLCNNNLDISSSVILNNQSIMENNIYIKYENNKIIISKKYYSETNGTIYNSSIIKNNANHTYIVGNVELSQKIDNNNFKVTGSPIITLKSTDNSYKQTAWVNKINDTNYYFDINIEQIDLNKLYYIEIDSNNIYNISAKRINTLIIDNISSSLEAKYTASIANNNISFIKKNTYLTISTYGQSGLKVIGDSRGSDLKYYKIGNGENILFATFALHGYEDLWAADGKELTIIAREFIQNLSLSNDSKIMDNWTIYVFPLCNPDGVKYGYTNNGPGRCTLTGINGVGVDMNRCWSTDFIASYINRNYTGSSPFGAYEAIYLRDFLLQNKSKYGQTILIDLHGWTTQLIGDKEICLDYYGPQFYNSYNESFSKYTSTYGKGYLVNWARTNLANLNGLPARSALIELPSNGITNHDSVVNAKYSEKYYNATINMLKGLL